MGQTHSGACSEVRLGFEELLSMLLSEGIHLPIFALASDAIRGPSRH